MCYSGSCGSGCCIGGCSAKVPLLRMNCLPSLPAGSSAPRLALQDAWKREVATVDCTTGWCSSARHTANCEKLTGPQPESTAGQWRRAPQFAWALAFWVSGRAHEGSGDGGEDKKTAFSPGIGPWSWYSRNESSSQAGSAAASAADQDTDGAVKQGMLAVECAVPQFEPQAVFYHGPLAHGPALLVMKALARVAWQRRWSCFWPQVAPHQLRPY